MGRKLDRLESLRGMAAIIVVICHYYELFAMSSSDQQTDSFPFSVFRTVAGCLPGEILLDGQLAVLVFFVLSGFVLSIQYLQMPRAEYLRSAALRRVPRLVIPSLASLMICFLLIRSGLWVTSMPMDGLDFVSQKLLLENGQVSREWYAFARESLLVFITQNPTYNRVLWTMSWEITGSFVVFAIIGVSAPLKRKWFVFCASVALFLILKEYYYLEFILGIIMCELFVRFPDSPRLKSIAATVGLLSLVLMLLINPDSAYGSLSGHFRRLAELQRPLCAAGIVACAAWETPISIHLNGNVLTALGRISFATYLLHLPVFLTFSIFLMSTLVSNGMSYGLALDLTFVLSLICLFPLATVFTRYVDLPAIALSKSFENWLRGSVS